MLLESRLNVCPSRVTAGISADTVDIGAAIVVSDATSRREGVDANSLETEVVAAGAWAVGPEITTTMLSVDMVVSSVAMPLEEPERAFPLPGSEFGAVSDAGSCAAVCTVLCEIVGLTTTTILDACGALAMPFVCGGGTTVAVTVASGASDALIVVVWRPLPSLGIVDVSCA